MGVGFQGAVYRYQITEYGTFFFPITREVDFVLNGTHSAKTALSIILWVVGTAILVCTAIYSFIHLNDVITDYYRQLMFGLIIACFIYLGSCIVQYGFLFRGPGGVSIPIGILLILLWTAIIYLYRDSFYNM